MNQAPQTLRLAKNGETLTIVYAEGSHSLSAEYLRVFSPSAEVRGHGGEWKTVAGKKNLRITDVVSVGHYAVRLVFSDGHQSGIYSWQTLHELVFNHANYWQSYLHALKQKGQTREQA